MSYINTKTNQYPLFEADIRREYPNTSFATPFQAPEDYAEVESTPQPVVENPILQYAKELAPKKLKTGYKQVWEVANIYATPEEEAEAVLRDTKNKKDRNKQEAMRFLKETDWVEVPSVSNTENIPHLSNFADFMTYRMALRMIAVAPDAEVVFPEKPAESWA